MYGVVDEDGGAVAQLEHPGAHHLVTRLDACEHRDLIAARLAELDEALAYDGVALSPCVGGLLDGIIW